MGLQFAKAWRCNGGSQLEVRKRVGGETGTEGPLLRLSELGLSYEEGVRRPPPLQTPTPTLAQHRRLPSESLKEMPEAGNCDH